MTASTQDLARPGADGFEAVDLGRTLSDEGAVRLGLHRAGPLPTEGLEGFDLLLSADPDAPRPWVGLPGAELDEVVAGLQDIVARRPAASLVLAQILRMSLRLPFQDALVAESLAYSMLLGGAEFQAWRAERPARLARIGSEEQRVRMTREDGALRITLARPGARNAVDAGMRDALVEALDFALIDPDVAPVILSGEGPSFSAGGDLDEFGQARDLAAAHIIRTQQSAALRVHRLRPRITARLHGACIGAGIEMPAAAGRVTAASDARFRLPEVSMGLIPGAGGTVTIPRRIGRRRTCYMALSGQVIDAVTALRWGLIDAVEAP